MVDITNMIALTKVPDLVGAGELFLGQRYNIFSNSSTNGTKMFMNFFGKFMNAGRIFVNIIVGFCAGEERA
jgi:hypothetical protein